MAGIPGGQMTIWRAFSAAVLIVSGVGSVACTTQAPTEPDVTTTTVPEGYPTAPVGDDEVRLNQLQLVGTHNSYHVAPVRTIQDLLREAAANFPQIAAALGNPASLNYTHASIPQQLARGLRTFEFDIYADPTGGRFSRPLLSKLVLFEDPMVPAGLSEPGFKMLHVADVDWRTRCVTLTDCLVAIREWSDTTPGHLPVVVNLELKGDGLPDPLVGTQVLPFDAGQLDALDAVLRSELGDRLITPDDVRGDAVDLNTAITTTGWPTLAESRGKVLFFMDNADLREPYLAGHPSLEGRVMFTSSGEGEPDGAILKVNEPGDGSRIADLVAQGYIVRTRADADLREAWAGDTSRADVALASGAQVVSTDFPVGETYPPTGYRVSFDDMAVQGRCNPANTTPAGCALAAVVEPG